MPDRFGRPKRRELLSAALMGLLIFVPVDRGGLFPSEGLRRRVRLVSEAGATPEQIAQVLDVEASEVRAWLALWH